MKHSDPLISRRALFQLGGAATLVAFAAPHQLLAADSAMHKRAIPATGEKLAIMGMGTSRTFDVRADEETLTELAQVLRKFFAAGGQLVDSSPMYGAAESVLGKTLALIDDDKGLFVATKVWIDGERAGIDQMKQSSKRIGVERIDLMQIHNLRDWKTHLRTLRRWKEQGKLRYIGVTTSHGRFHEELERLLRSEPFDFVQFSYSIADRSVEKALLPLARDKGIATLINRPFERGDLFRAVKGKALPPWASEIDCRSWAQFFLKFVAGHPDVTCLIPATSRPAHMADNMGAGHGRLPGEKMRQRMAMYVASL